MDNYPIGTENDHKAPWNQEENEEKEICVTVSITLSKIVKIRVSDYEIIDKGLDEDREYYEDIDYSNCDLKQAVKDQIYLPNEAFEYINHPIRAKKDLANWNIDDFEVIPD